MRKRYKIKYNKCVQGCPVIAGNKSVRPGNTAPIKRLNTNGNCSLPVINLDVIL